MSINAGSSVFTNQPVPAFKLDTTTLAGGDLLVFDDAEQAFVNTANTNTTSVQSTPGATGSDIFIDAVDGVLTFKTINAGAGVTITDTGTALTISADPSNQISAINLGSGEGVFESKDGFELRFKSINTAVGNKNLSVSSTGNEIQIQNLAEINTGTNTGGAAGVFRGKTGETLEFKSIDVIGDMGINENADTIELFSNYLVTPNELVLGDSPTNLKTLGRGPVGSILKVGSGADLEWSESEVQGYTFRVTFEQDGGVDVADQLPAGWTTNITGNLITVTHTVGKPLRQLAYWGHDSVTSTLRYRQPTGTHQVTIPTGNLNDKFAINVISQVAGAEVNGYAIVSVQF